MDPGWILAIIAAGTTVCTLAGFLMRWAWHTITRTGRFLDDYFGEPAREGMQARPGVMGRLQSLEDKITAVLSETKPDGGDSLRDELRRVGGDVAEVKDTLEVVAGRVDRNVDAVSRLTGRVELFEQQRKARNTDA